MFILAILGKAKIKQTNDSTFQLHNDNTLQIFRVKSWKRRWFILNDNCLYYFEFTTDKEPRGIIPLENIRVRETADRSKPHCFELFAAGNEVIKACKTDSDGKVVEGKICTEYRATQYLESFIRLTSN